MTDIELADEIERKAAIGDGHVALTDEKWQQIIAALRQTALAQTEIKGHMRTEDDLKTDLLKANEAAVRWYMAASPHATPEALRSALDDAESYIASLKSRA